MTDPDEIADDLYLIEILLRYCQPKEPEYKLADAIAGAEINGGQTA